MEVFKLFQVSISILLQRQKQNSIICESMVFHLMYWITYNVTLHKTNLDMNDPVCIVTYHCTFQDFFSPYSSFLPWWNVHLHSNSHFSFEAVRDIRILSQSFFFVSLPTTMSVEKRNVREAETSEFALTFASFKFFEWVNLVAPLMTKILYSRTETFRYSFHLVILK